MICTELSKQYHNILILNVFYRKPPIDLGRAKSQLLRRLIGLRALSND